MEKREDDPIRKQPDWRKIILFNGPPQCGKSTGANYAMSFIRRNANWTNPRFMEIAEPLKRAAHALYSAFHAWDYYDSKEGSHLKGLASGDFLGLSPREAYIALSEEFMKPKHGPEVMGFLMRKRILRENFTKVFVIPSAGFLDELKPIIDLVGQRSILIIEVHAAGCSFENDSRGFIGDAAKEKYPHINVRKLPNTFGNEEDKNLYRILVEGSVKSFLKIEEKDER